MADHPQNTHRLLAMDILRGFALLGVLIANLQSLTYPGSYLPPLGFDHAGALDRGAEVFIRTVTEGSFYPLFATLFGLGFALQMQKPGFTPAYFRRRLLVLLGFGLLHAIFVWEGDILISYALLGFALIPLRTKSNRTLLGVISICLIYTLVITYFAFRTADVPAPYLEHLLATYSTGSYLQASQQRLFDLLNIIVEAVVFFPHLLACFLIGLLIGRRGVSETLTNRRLLHNTLSLGLILGLPIVCAHALSLTQPLPLLTALDMTLGSGALGFAYAAALLLLLQLPGWQQWLEPLAAVGRMSLSNYLMQSMVFTTLYYGYGGGLYAQVPLSVSVLLALALYGLQVLTSRWWLAHHAQGPLEALWRRLVSQKRHAGPLETT